MSKTPKAPDTGGWWVAVVLVAFAAVALGAWAWLSEGRFGDIDTLSSVGWIVMTAIVGVAFLVEWFRDWRMLRALRHYLAKTRAERRSRDMRGSKGK